MQLQTFPLFSCRPAPRACAPRGQVYHIKGLISQRGVCVLYFSHSCDKTLDRKQFKAGGVCLALVTSITVGKAGCCGEEHLVTLCLQKGSKETQTVGVCLLFLFIQCGIPLHGMVLLTFRMTLPSSAEPQYPS